MQQTLFNARYFPPLLQALEDLEGPDVVERGLSKIELPSSAIDGSTIYLPYKLQAAFWEEAARGAGDRHLGARLGSLLPYGYLDVYARYVLSGETLHDGLLRAVKALKFVVSGITVNIAVRGRYLAIRFDTRIGGVVGARQIHESLPIITATMVRHFAGPGWEPAWIELDQPISARASALEEIYNAPVKLGAKLPALVFEAGLLEQTNPSEQPLQQQVTLRDLRILAAQAPPRRFASVVRDAIDLQMSIGHVSAETVAARLGIGVRGLQRRLSSEGTTFQECLDRARYARAMGLLLETRATDAEIAEALCFREVNSFRRAFLHWSGESPRSYRGGRQLPSSNSSFLGKICAEQKLKIASKSENDAIG